MAQGGVGQAAGHGGATSENPQGGVTNQAAGWGGAESGQAFAPSVMLREPASAAELAEDTPITSTSETIEVICRAVKASEAGARAVNPSTVAIVLVDADGAEHAAAAVTPSKDREDEYTTVFVIGADYAPGRAEIRCTAEDSSSPPAAATATAYVYLDHGPTIEVVSPAEDSVESVNEPLRFEYRITPTPLGDQDPGAEIASAELVVGEQTFELEEDPKQAGTYGTNVDFSDPTLFSVPPTGTTSVLVRAYNARDVAHEVAHAFTLDGTPPVITVTSPKDGAVVGGFVKLDFEITDDLAGVDPSTIKVVVAEFEFKRDWGNGPKYSLKFDSANPEFGAVVQLAVRISARDKAGNDDGLGASMLLYLDTVPPLVTLDPPHVTERRKTAADEYECSEFFDALGDAPGDGSVFYNWVLPRAMVWERTNGTNDQRLFVYAGTDESSVYIYVQPDPDVPLLGDSNDDGYCDAVDTTGMVESDRNRFTQLVPIKAAGASFFSDTGSTEEQVQILGSVECSFGKDPKRPDQLCDDSSDLSRAVGQKIWTASGANTTAPLIYGLGSLDGGACTGRQWELATLVPQDQEGWICLAARAQDTVGNIGVSRPLRLCLDRDDDAHPETPACVDSQDDAPTCTDGCIIPASFDFEGTIVIDL